MKQYKKKPVVIEAIQFVDDAERILEIQEFMGGGLLRVNYEDPENPFIRIETLEGEMKAMVGDYIIKGVNGEFYPCKPDIFEKTYDEEKETTFLDRLHIELKDLYSKMDKLSPFIESGKIDEVITDPYQNNLLRLQHRIMSRYINILECRIGRLDGSPKAPLYQMTFGEAIDVLKQGRLVRRVGWVDKGMFLFIRPADSLSVDFIVDKVKSLPDSFKSWVSDNYEVKDSIMFAKYICMRDADGSITNGWNATQEDMLAVDWEIVE